MHVLRLPLAEARLDVRAGSTWTREEQIIHSKKSKSSSIIRYAARLRASDEMNSILSGLSPSTFAASVAVEYLQRDMISSLTNFKIAYITHITPLPPAAAVVAKPVHMIAKHITRSARQPLIPSSSILYPCAYCLCCDCLLLLPPSRAHFQVLSLVSVGSFDQPRH